MMSFFSEFFRSFINKNICILLYHYNINNKIIFEKQKKIQKSKKRFENLIIPNFYISMILLTLKRRKFTLISINLIKGK